MGQGRRGLGTPPRSFSRGVGAPATGRIGPGSEAGCLRRQREAPRSAAGGGRISQVVGLARSSNGNARRPPPPHDRRIGVAGQAVASMQTRARAPPAIRGRAGFPGRVPRSPVPRAVLLATNSGDPSPPGRLNSRQAAVDSRREGPARGRPPRAGASSAAGVGAADERRAVREDLHQPLGMAADEVVMHPAPVHRARPSNPRSRPHRPRCGRRRPRPTPTRPHPRRRPGRRRAVPIANGATPGRPPGRTRPPPPRRAVGSRDRGSSTRRARDPPPGEADTRGPAAARGPARGSRG